MSDSLKQSQQSSIYQQQLNFYSRYTRTNHHFYVGSLYYHIGQQLPQIHIRISKPKQKYISNIQYQSDRTESIQIMTDIPFDTMNKNLESYQSMKQENVILFENEQQQVESFQGNTYSESKSINSSQVFQSKQQQKQQQKQQKSLTQNISNHNIEINQQPSVHQSIHQQQLINNIQNQQQSSNSNTLQNRSINTQQIIPQPQIIQLPKKQQTQNINHQQHIIVEQQQMQINDNQIQNLQQIEQQISNMIAQQNSNQVHQENIVQNQISFDESLNSNKQQINHQQLRENNGISLRPLQISDIKSSIHQQITFSDYSSNSNIKQQEPYQNQNIPVVIPFKLLVKQKIHHNADQHQSSIQQQKVPNKIPFKLAGKKKPGQLFTQNIPKEGKVNDRDLIIQKKNFSKRFIRKSPIKMLEINFEQLNLKSRNSKHLLSDNLT